MYTANQIADFFLLNVKSTSGDTISHLKLQKLVYYAQAWNYTLFGEPLFEERVEAWMHGPVIRSVYDRLQHHQVYMPIHFATIDVEKVDFDERTSDLLNEIQQVYGEHTSSYLEDLTHSEAPWIDARNGLPSYARCNNEITLEAMKAYYATLS